MPLKFLSIPQWSSVFNYAAINETELEISKGQDVLRRFVMNEGEKYFCGECGTPIFNVNHQYAGMRMIYFGTMENADAIAPKVNIWCESMLNWVSSIADITSRPRAIGQKKKVSHNRDGG